MPVLAKRTSILVIVCRDFTHLLAYFLQAQMMRKYTQNDKHQVCPAYLLLCSIFLHESVFNVCFLSLSAALISLGDSSSPPVCFLRRRTNVNNTINFLSLETTFRNKQRKLHCKREKYFLWWVSSLCLLYYSSTHVS